MTREEAIRICYKVSGRNSTDIVAALEALELIKFDEVDLIKEAEKYTGDLIMYNDKSPEQVIGKMSNIIRDLLKRIKTG